MTTRASILFCFLTLICMAGAGCNAPEKRQADTQNSGSNLENHFGLGGAPIDVVVTLSTHSLKLTDFLTVTVRVEHEEGVQVEPPYLSESVYSPLMLTRSPREDLFWSETKNRVVKSWSYRFEPMQSGTFKIRPFQVFFRLEAEKPANDADWPLHRIETAAIPYEVTAVALDASTDIRDIQGLILPDYDYRPLLVTAAAIAVLFLLLQLGRRLKRDKATPDSSPAASIDYLAEALRRLDELEAADYISRREYERLHVGLAAIMRDFIEHQFGLRALEQTTDEFIREIRTSPHFTLEQQAILRQFLELADLVKFASYDPGSGASREALNTVRHFIESTRPQNED